MQTAFTANLTTKTASLTQSKIFSALEKWFGDDSQYCFGFRKNREILSVTWWKDDHWRKISNLPEDFILFYYLSIQNDELKSSVQIKIPTLGY